MVRVVVMMIRFSYSMPTTQHIYVLYIQANVRCELTPSRVSHTKFARVNHEPLPSAPFVEYTGRVRASVSVGCMPEPDTLASTHAETFACGVQGVLARP